MENTMTDKYRRAIIQRIKDLRKERGITQIQNGRLKSEFKSIPYFQNGELEIIVSPLTF